MTPTTRFIVLALAALTVIRLVIGAVNELTPGEAYHFLWAQHLDLAYYSNGPGIALAMKLTTSLFGATEFGVRLLSPLLGFATSLLVFRLGRHLFDEQTAAWGVALLNLTPLFNVGSTLFTTDALSIFFWVAALLTLWRALHRAASINFYWPLTGLLIGLGFLCDYAGILQLLSVLLLLAVSRRWRGQLRRPGPSLLLGTFLLCTLPVILWNAANGWISLAPLQAHRSLGQFLPVEPRTALEFVTLRFGLFSPFIFAGLLWAIGRAIKRYRLHDSETFLLFFTLPIVLFSFALAFTDAGKTNWAAPGFIAAGLLLVHYWQDLQLDNRLRRNLRSAALTLAGILSCVALNTEIVRQAGLPWPYESDPSRHLRGWRESAAYLEEVLHATTETLGEQPFLIARSHEDAAILSFYLSPEAPLFRPGPAYPRIHIIESQSIENQFSFWPRYDAAGEGSESPFLGKHALHITTLGHAVPRPPPGNIVNAFERSEITGITDITRHNYFLRRLAIDTCYNYRGLPL